MSCNQCGTKFNLFHKEVGCASCGLTFCKNCVKQKLEIPGKGPGKFNVCKGCYIKQTSGNKSSQQAENLPPPDAYIKRLETLENPAAPPITVYRQNPKTAAFRNVLSPKDRELLDRLEKLKGKDKCPPSEEELRRRLESLKDEQNFVREPVTKQFTGDSRTDSEKVESLLEMYASETNMDVEVTRHKPEDHIEARLAKLRGQEPSKKSDLAASNKSSSDSEEEADKLTKRIMDEVSLEAKLPQSLASAGNLASAEDAELNEEESDQLPWCVLCNKDARYKCLDCDGDLYCSECNTEVHKEWADENHRVIRYEPK